MLHEVYTLRSITGSHSIPQSKSNTTPTYERAYAHSDTTTRRPAFPLTNSDLKPQISTMRNPNSCAMYKQHPTVQLSARFKPYPECPFPNKSQRIAAADDASHHLSSQPTAQHHQLFPSLQMHSLPIPCSFVIQDQIYIAGSRRAPTPPVVSPSRLARPPAWGLRSWGWDKLLGYL
jgi:hypothetical protein